MRSEPRTAAARRALQLTRLSLAAASLAACNGTTSYMDASGRTGRDEATLGWWLTGTAAVVVAIVCMAILAGLAKHRGERNAPAAADARDGDAGTERRAVRSGLSWIYVGAALTLVVLVAAFGGTMVTLQAASHPPRAPTLTLDVIGHQWWWEIRYAEAGHPELGFVTANEVHLPVGVPVRVRLRTADVIHSFWMPQIAGKMDLIPGQVNETWVQADRAGSSRGTCGEYCGLQHATMALAVDAEPLAAFRAWAVERRAEAAPATGEARAGQIVFQRSCGTCHAVGGTNALGRFGPDLTHVASRPTIGAGALENTPANLARWIRHAPDVKEGTRMPEIPLDDAELRAVVAYLRTLR